jgi:hypothetical protein
LEATAHQLCVAHRIARTVIDKSVVLLLSQVLLLLLLLLLMPLLCSMQAHAAYFSQVCAVCCICMYVYACICM